MGKFLKGAKTYISSAAAAILGIQQLLDQLPDGFQWSDFKTSGPILFLAIANILNRRATKQSAAK